MPKLLLRMIPIVCLLLFIGSITEYFLLHHSVHNQEIKLTANNIRAKSLETNISHLKSQESNNTKTPVSQLPRVEDEPGILTILQQTSGASSVDIQTVNFGSSLTGTGMKSVKVNLNGTGSENGCLNFIQALSKASRPTILDSVTFSGPAEKTTFTCVVEFPYANN